MSEQEKKQPKQPKKNFRWYWLARFVGALLFHTAIPVKYTHRERLNGIEGAAIIIGNHASMLDPIAMAYPIKKRKVIFLGKKELMKNKFAAEIFNGMNMIPVDRHNTDMRAMRQCIQTLRQGNLLGVFPEGTRHHNGLMEELESGVSLIALQSKAPLIPIYIHPKLSPFHFVRVDIGEPIDYSDLLAEGVSNETAQKLLNRITETYQKMAEASEK